MIDYSIYKYCDLKLIAIDWDLWFENNPVDDILLNVKETILNTNWLPAFSQIYQNHIKTKPDSELNYYFNKYLLDKQCYPYSLTIILQLESSIIYVKRNDRYSVKRLTKLAYITKMTIQEDGLIIEWAFLDDKKWLASFGISLKKISHKVEKLIKSALKIDILVTFKLDEKSLEIIIREYETYKIIKKQKILEYTIRLKREAEEQVVLIQREQEHKEIEKAQIEQTMHRIEKEVEKFSTGQKERCPHCNSKVKTSNLKKHLIKVHMNKYE